MTNDERVAMAMDVVVDVARLIRRGGHASAVAHIRGVINDAEARGRAEERARIVAWLDEAHRAHYYRGDRLDLGMVAHDIENGAHTEGT